MTGQQPQDLPEWGFAARYAWSVSLHSSQPSYDPQGLTHHPVFTQEDRLREMKCPAQVLTAGTRRVDIPQAGVPNSKTHACPMNPGIGAGLSGNISLRTGVGTSLSKTVKRCVA